MINLRGNIRVIAGRSRPKRSFVIRDSANQPVVLAGPYRRLQRVFRKKSTRRRGIAIAIVSGNFLVLVAVVLIVFLSSHGNTGAVAADVASVANANQYVSNPLDQVSSAGIAETVARMGSLPETTAVTNQADSESTELAMAPVTANIVDKPQVVSSTSGFASNKDIKTYEAVQGDTITSIASKFGITSDSIRWSNGLTGDSVAVGTKLLIPPVTGIAYKVANGDTVASLAGKFKADQNKITAYNDAEISGLQLGELILIPDGSVAAPAPTVRASSSSSWSGSATYGGFNGYDFGYCTYWVAKLRSQSGAPLPTNLGNASTWVARAAAMGLATGSTPQVGAAVVTKTTGEGHVAYVTAVNGDGTITVSEMNHDGWNRVDSRTLSSDGFRYIY